MIIIELVGFLHSELSGLKKQILKAFQNTEYLQNIGLTIANSLVTDHKDRNQPFLRLSCLPNFPHDETILQVLDDLGVDIVIIPGSKFIKATKERRLTKE